LSNASSAVMSLGAPLSKRTLRLGKSAVTATAAVRFWPPPCRIAITVEIPFSSAAHPYLP
jgi:hypothetical protein